MVELFTERRDLVDHALGSVADVLLASTLGLLCKLADVHKEIWNQENLARSLLAGAFVIADTKRCIDRLNATRHNLVDAIDRETIQICQTPTVHYSETPGELSDRLLIITLKFLANSEISIDPSMPEGYQQDGRRRLLELHIWRQHLQGCLLSELKDIAAGIAAVPPRAEFKLYNDEILNPVLRSEQR